MLPLANRFQMGLNTPPLAYAASKTKHTERCQTACEGLNFIVFVRLMALRLCIYCCSWGCYAAVQNLYTGQSADSPVQCGVLDVA